MIGMERGARAGSTVLVFNRIQKSKMTVWGMAPYLERLELLWSDSQQWWLVMNSFSKLLMIVAHPTGYGIGRWQYWIGDRRRTSPSYKSIFH
mmetsp:Transcript_29212/g.53544  ORF Transcript_29212/g.53544 Transcript_29212/m.53544 type:complete len:92 (+) Transcript_29212:200-475(+)